jgi:deoxycytidylate deaminase
MQIYINEDIMNQLRELTNLSTYPKHSLAAGLVYKNKLISFGYSQMKSHTFQKKYGKNDDAIYLHAEVNCIHNAIRSGFDRFDKSTLYVVRTKWNGPFEDKFKVDGISKPCSGCMKCVIDYKIKNVIYTNDNIEGIDDHYGIIQI